MNPTPEEVLTILISIAPSFESQWEDYWLPEDGPFTYCGLFIEFTHFVRDHFSEMPPSKHKELMDFIESCVTNDDSDLDTAACACFLENLSGEPPLSGQLRTYMGPKSLSFFNLWDSTASF